MRSYIKHPGSLREDKPLPRRFRFPFRCVISSSLFFSLPCSSTTQPCHRAAQSQEVCLRIRRSSFSPLSPFCLTLRRPSRAAELPSRPASSSFAQGTSVLFSVPVSVCTRLERRRGQWSDQRVEPVVPQLSLGIYFLVFISRTHRRADNACYSVG